MPLLTGSLPDRALARSLAKRETTEESILKTRSHVIQGDAELCHLATVVTHVETEVSAAVSGHRRLGPGDFEFLRVVGQGAFGKVFQVRKRDTQEIFAMKVMRKDRILERRHGEYVRAERDALTAVVHPYIVTLRYSFQVILFCVIS